MSGTVEFQLTLPTRLFRRLMDTQDWLTLLGKWLREYGPDTDTPNRMVWLRNDTYSTRWLRMPPDLELMLEREDIDEIATDAVERGLLGLAQESAKRKK